MNDFCFQEMTPLNTLTLKQHNSDEGGGAADASCLGLGLGSAWDSAWALCPLCTTRPDAPEAGTPVSYSERVRQQNLLRTPVLPNLQHGAASVAPPVLGVELSLAKYNHDKTEWRQ